MISTPEKENSSICPTLTPVRFLDSPKPSSPKDAQLVNLNRLQTILENLQDNQTKWILAQKRSQSLSTSIEAIKSKVFTNSFVSEMEYEDASLFYYPKELKPYCDKLAIIQTVFEDILKNAVESLKQIKALFASTTDKSQIPYKTWSWGHFIKFTEYLIDRYENEVAAKKHVTENIAHAENRCDLMILSGLMEYPVYVNDEVRLQFKFLSKELEKNV